MNLCLKYHVIQKPFVVFTIQSMGKVIKEITQHCQSVAGAELGNNLILESAETDLCVESSSSPWQVEYQQE